MSDKPTSLRRVLIVRMLSTMLPLFLLLWAVAYFSGAYFINAAFDRSLARRTYALADRVVVLRGRVRVDLPVAARELLAFDQEDLLSHSISDASGTVIDGGADMPPLPAGKQLRPGRLLIYDGYKGGEKVRVAAFALSLAGTSARGTALVKVAETLTHRTALAEQATLAIVVPMLLMTLAAAAAIAYGVGRGLAPLQRLRERLTKRPPLDLSPVPLQGTPAELRPFLEEINSLLQRLSEATEAQSRFVADAAHQLRTPIAGIRSQAEAALDESGHPAEQHALRRIAQAALGMGNLVQKLLMLARVDAAQNTLRLSRVDSGALIRDIAREWAPKLLESGIEISFCGAEQPLVVMGDVQLLREMVTNLVDNAQRYGATQIVLGVDSAADGVNWRVTDNGPGIAAHQREAVLAPFHRLSDSIEGAGVGLTLVARIARLHGATLHLESVPAGNGLSVRIAFPAAPSPA